jgi:hypothetical protein
MSAILSARWPEAILGFLVDLHDNCTQLSQPVGRDWSVGRVGLRGDRALRQWGKAGQALASASAEIEHRTGCGKLLPNATHVVPGERIFD